MSNPIHYSICRHCGQAVVINGFHTCTPTMPPAPSVPSPNQLTEEDVRRIVREELEKRDDN